MQTKRTLVTSGGYSPIPVIVKDLRLFALVVAIVAAALAVGATGCGSDDSSSRQILFLSDRDGEWAVYSMDPAGRSQHRLMDAGHVDPFGSGIGFGEPVVSPDGAEGRARAARRDGREPRHRGDKTTRRG
jgi:hypothetical protein